MAHPPIEPLPGEQHTIQQGVGQGTTIRRRRKPRKEVNDVEISQASGASLGPDGNYHPLETTSQGQLKVAPKDTNDFLEELLAYQKMTVFLLAELAHLEYDEVIEEFL